jgi:formate hydrogenlyase transcriptional activator
VELSTPGSVRELENLIERAMIVCDGTTLAIDASWLVNSSTPLQANTSLRERERQAIVDALAQCRGKIYGADGAAARLGLKPTTLYGKIRKLGIQNDAR